MSDTKQLKRIIEGALFASAEPLTIERISEIFLESDKPDKKTIHQLLSDLSNDYADRGIELKELASGFQFQVKADLSNWIKNLFAERPAKYSRALLETLALIAYRQPITRGEIEEIRGVVVSSQMIKTLLDREWIRIVGYREVPGKPALYATTKQFLDHFGLKELDNLPTLSEIRNLDKMEQDLEQQFPTQNENASEVASETAELKNEISVASVDNSSDKKEWE